MPLHLDYRPRTFSEIVGNEATVNSLKSILAREDRPHSYLFYGPSGTGKTTLARIFARELGCSELEIHELNVANTRGMDTIREKIQQGFYAPLSGDVKVYIWDEVHQLLRASEEALLKFLEDTPSHVYNILCTTNPEKLLKTIKTRCTTYATSSLTAIETKRLLKWVLDDMKFALSDNVQSTLVSASEGCPRKLLVALDQISDMQDEQEQIETIMSASNESNMINICRTIMERGKADTKWPKIAKILEALDEDPEQARRGILGYFTKVLLGCKGEEGKRIATIISGFVVPYYDSGKAGLVASCYMACLI